MGPIAAAAVASGISALIKVWAEHKGKPVGWIPDQADWDEIEAEAQLKNAAYYKATPEEQARMQGLDG